MESNKIIKTYAAILILTIIVLFFIKSFDISYPLSINITSRSSELAVVGEGKVEATYDTASVQAGITVANAPTINDAQKTIDETNNKIIDSMKKLGIEKSDIKTSNYSINPSYTYESGTNNISGYSGDASVSIKVKKLDLVPSVIEEATKAGANKVSAGGFSIENPQKYREDARNKAIENAKSEAGKLANSLGIRLGRITNIVESSPSNINPAVYSSAMLDTTGRGGGSPNIEPGSQTITSTVTLYFEKK